ncbi:MAG: class I SAM-dependent methyltransferase [Gemmatimonadaceae bacterium]
MPNILDIRDSYHSTLAFVPTRTEFPVLLNGRGLIGCGAEIGVQQGDYSATILRYWRGMHLISIDPWHEDRPENYVDIANVSQAQHNAFFETTRMKLAPFGDRSTIWRMTSLEGAARIPASSLDFVYIDARHDYASVLEDLAAWFPKVRPRGIVAGHDYIDGHFAAGEFGVKRAVDEFCGARELRVYATLLDAPWLTWFVEVPPPAWEAEVPDA